MSTAGVIHVHSISFGPWASIRAASIEPSGPRGREARTPQTSTPSAGKVVDFLVRAKVPYLIIGGLAVSTFHW